MSHRIRTELGNRLFSLAILDDADPGEVEDIIVEMEHQRPEREALVRALDTLPDYYFPDGTEYGELREMADEMLARWA